MVRHKLHESELAAYLTKLARIAISARGSRAGIELIHKRWGSGAVTG